MSKNTKAKGSKSGKADKADKADKTGTSGAADGGSGDVGTVLLHQTVWEDTIIIAFRDLQWHHWRKAVTDAAEPERTARLATSPADLHKLDHNAESAFGDVLTSQGARYFLFEFKAVRDGHLDEQGKGMFERLSHLVADTEAAIKTDPELRPKVAYLLEVTERCHFGVFGQRVALPAADTGASLTSSRPLPDADALISQMIGTGTTSLRAGAVQLRLQADPYIEWVKLANRRLGDAFIKKGAKEQTEASDAKEQTWQQNATALASELTRATVKAAAESMAALAKKLQREADALEAKANHAQMMANREARAARIADGKDAIESISIDKIGKPIPLESIVWPETPDAPYGVSLDELAAYLMVLLDLPGPGQPPRPKDGGSPGDEIRLNLVRVVDKTVVQWTLTVADVRASVALRQIIDRFAANIREDTVHDDTGGSPPSMPSTTTQEQHRKYGSVGGTEKEKSEDPEDQG